jgi:hypothetical protein
MLAPPGFRADCLTFGKSVFSQASIREHARFENNECRTHVWMTVLPLPGLIELTARPALAPGAGTANKIEKPADVDTLVAELRIAARAAADISRAKSTERAYKNDWRDFCAFAGLIGRAPHPA